MANNCAETVRMPPQSQTDIAVQWLLSNEGRDGEAEACKAVAEWIDHLQSEAYLRKTARAAGVTVARLRRKLAENRHAVCP